MESALSVKGQATIPRAVREHLGLSPGDRVKFFIHPNGSVVILPKIPIRTLKGIVRSRKGYVSLEDMERGVTEGATLRSMPSRSVPKR